MKYRTAGSILFGALLTTLGIGLAPGVAKAHHPLVTGVTQCRVDSWSVTWTARADTTRDLTWDVTTAGFAPDGFQSDALSFTRTVTYPATQTSATQNVNAVWSNQATGSGSATVERPPVCEQSTTTTEPEETTTSSTTTTTTSPSSTTTSSVAIDTTDPTSTLVQVGEPPVPPVSPVLSTVEIGESPISPSNELPATGNGPDLAVAAGVLLMLGVTAVSVTRRRP